ncbi:uncharacterized protein [Battus philenor]|uniref:uncharacterized protein n=1 Tax=Battus philenor TaxID=42288 RepID=UPI0035CF8316
MSLEHFKIIDITELYGKELLFYAELSKIFKQLEQEAGIPKEEQYKSIESYNESNTKAIILKNIAKDGFGTVHRMEVMPLKFAELSVQQLAKFHSLSFVIEEKLPKYFENNLRILEQSTKFDDNFKRFFRNVNNFAIAELDSVTRERLEIRLPEILERFQDYMSGNKARVKCLCHGDYKMNNILMKTEDGEVSEVIPVDYQLLHYGTPITDLIYLIFTGSDQEFRRNHLNHLKDMYYDTMESYLKYFNIDIETKYARKTFERDFDQCLEFGLSVALFILPFFFILKDEVPDLNKTDILDVSANLDNRYRERLLGVIDDMINWGKL